MMKQTGCRKLRWTIPLRCDLSVFQTLIHQKKELEYAYMKKRLNAEHLSGLSMKVVLAQLSA